MLECKNLSKTYLMKSNFWSRKKSKKIVSNINICIPKGKVVGLLGVNGSGKTTIIKMLSGMIEPTDGHITLNSNIINSNNKRFKEKIGIISGNDLGVYNNLTGKENLEYISSLYGFDKKQRLYNIEKVLKIVDLEDSANIKVENYSLGMKQRLKIAIGIIHNPEYIFLDEPTIGLDILIAKEIRKFIKILSKNSGILLTTHYISEAEELCDYVYILDKGNIIYEGSPKNLKLMENEILYLRIVLKEKNYKFFKELENLSSIIDIKINELGKDYSYKFNKNVNKSILEKILKYNVEIESYSFIEPNFEERLENLLYKVKG